MTSADIKATYGSKDIKEYNEYLRQPENIELLRKNDLDTLFFKMTEGDLTSLIGIISYTTDLLYSKGFLVENYVTKTYCGQFRFVDKKHFIFPKCKYIYNNSFATNKHIEEIEAPNALFVDNAAFAYCENLYKVYFPKLTKVGETAFARCASLTDDNIKIPQDCKIEPDWDNWKLWD